MLQTAIKHYYEPYSEEYQASIKHNDNKTVNAKCDKKHKFSFRAKAVLTVMICFVTCFIVLYRYSIITESTYKINQYNKELQKLISANSRLSIEADKSVDLVSIEKIAKVRLGMQRPDQYQIVYLRVPMEDCTQVAENIYMNTSNTKQVLTGVKNVFFSSINQGFGRMVRFLY